MRFEGISHTSLELLESPNLLGIDRQIAYAKSKYLELLYIFYVNNVNRPGHLENWNGSIWRASKCGVGGE